MFELIISAAIIVIVVILLIGWDGYNNTGSWWG